MRQVSVQRIVCAIVAIASLLVPGVASASPPSPPSASAVAQYVEAVPTSTGNKAAGVGTTKSAPLTASARRAVIAEGGAQAQPLLTVATSSAYGAPVHSPRLGNSTRDKTTTLLRPAEQHALGASISSAASGLGLARILILGLIMAGSTVAIVLSAAHTGR